MRSLGRKSLLARPRARGAFAASAAAAVMLASPAAWATTLMVGPSETYPTPCAAVAAAAAYDEIDIAVGTYTDTCTISTEGLHLKGVGGQPTVNVTGETPAGQKGVYAIEADNVIIENLELTGAQISPSAGENAAGLRIQANGVIVTNCYIHDNQNGILGGPVTGDYTGSLTIDHSQFSSNSLGSGCTDGNGCTHNLYLGKWAHVLFQFNDSHSAGSDGGHLLKSRALETDILYNRLTGEMGDDSYEIDLPQGGLAVVVGNVIEKGPNSQNTGTVLLYGDPGDGGFGPGPNLLYATNNTFVNDSSGSPTFIHVSAGGTLAVAHDNLFSGTGTPSSTGALSADNLLTQSPMFVNPTTYDYHLMAGSPAVGKGVPEGSAGAFSLVPVFEYEDVASAVVRTAATDLGAFEYGTNVSNPSADAGAESPDASILSELDASPRSVDSSAPLGDDATDDATFAEDANIGETDSGQSPPVADSGASADAAPSTDSGAHAADAAAQADGGGKPSASSGSKKSGCSCGVVGQGAGPDDRAEYGALAVGLGIVVAGVRRRGAIRRGAAKDDDARRSPGARRA